MVGVFRPWIVVELPLKESSGNWLSRDFSQYFGISDSVLAQQFHTTARHCIRSIVNGVGYGKTERAAISLNLAPSCLALIRHGNRDRLG